MSEFGVSMSDAEQEECEGMLGNMDDAFDELSDLLSGEQDEFDMYDLNEYVMSGIEDILI